MPRAFWLFQWLHFHSVDKEFQITIKVGRINKAPNVNKTRFDGFNVFPKHTSTLDFLVRRRLFLLARQSSYKRCAKFFFCEGVQ